VSGAEIFETVWRRGMAITRRAGTYRLLLALSVVAGAGLGVVGSAGGATDVEVRSPWDVEGAGPGGRSIDIEVPLRNGCEGSPRAIVQETRSSVALRVLKTVPRPDEQVVCTAVFRIVTVRVPLSSAIDGRAIRGRSHPAGVDLRLGSVPRVVGLSPWEAKRALRLRALKQRIRYSRRAVRPQVLGQAPGGGSTLGPGGVVRLHIAVR
jgi:hypothetical protein